MTGMLLLLYFTSECEDSEVKVFEALVIGQDGEDAGMGSWGRPERTHQTSWRFGPGLDGCTLLPHKERADKYYLCPPGFTLGQQLQFSDKEEASVQEELPNFQNSLLDMALG